MTHCNDPKHEVPCLLPCQACEEECLHEGCECAYCDKVIEKEDQGTASPAGSMHLWCAVKHEHENPEDW